MATSVRWRAGGRVLSVALLSGMALTSAAYLPSEAMSAPDASGSHAIPARLSAPPTFKAALKTQVHLHVRNIQHHVVKQVTSIHRVATRTVGYTVAASAGAPTWSSSPPGGISQWAIPPGHPAWSIADFAGDPYSGSYGSCTWWAYYRHRSWPVLQMGMAGSWASRAAALGLPVGSSPAVGAVAVFAPGVQGAGGSGHVAVVESVLGGGWFMVSEMNFTFNGGGWGRVSYRYAHTGAGVRFIY